MLLKGAVITFHCLSAIVNPDVVAIVDLNVCRACEVYKFLESFHCNESGYLPQPDRPL